MTSKITMPNPCHQSWNEMTAYGNGRHCDSCCKVVVDFTMMSNSEILNYLAANKGTCGKFDTYQIESINSKVTGQLNKNRFSWKSLTIAASIISITPSIKVEAKAWPTIEFSPAIFKQKDGLASPDSNQFITIRGRLIDSDKSPINGVTIRLKGTTTGALTNVNGEFKMQVPATSNIVISFVGYQTQEFTSSKFAGSDIQTICLQARPMIMGEPVIVHRKMPFYKRWFYKIKRIF